VSKNKRPNAKKNVLNSNLSTAVGAFSSLLMKTLAFATFAASLNLAETARAASPQCQLVFDQASDTSAQSPDSVWRASPGSLFMGIRSNCLQYWTWVKALRTTGTGLTQIDPRLLSEGIVTGDPHLLNFGDLLINGRRKFRLIDLDDAGHGPVFFDFVKFVTASRSLEIGMTTAQLVDSYKMGLTGNKLKKSMAINDALDISEKNDQRIQADYLESMTKDDEFNYKGTGLVELKRSESKTQATYAKGKDAFRAALKDFKILDVAVRTKETGGSAGQARFWILVQDAKKQKFMFEFKPIGDAGPGVVSPQLDPVARTKEVMDLYWNHETDPAFQLIQAGTDAYLMRPRLRYGLAVKDVTKDKQKQLAREISLHIAYHMGRMVRRQAALGPYIAAFTEDSAKTQALVESIASLYLADAQRLHALSNSGEKNAFAPSLNP
jgi:hypothetical protein